MYSFPSSSHPFLPEITALSVCADLATIMQGGVQHLHFSKKDEQEEISMQAFFFSFFFFLSLITYSQSDTLL